MVAGSKIKHEGTKSNLAEFELVKQAVLKDGKGNVGDIKLTMITPAVSDVWKL